MVKSSYKQRVVTQSAAPANIFTIDLLLILFLNVVLIVTPEIAVVSLGLILALHQLVGSQRFARARVLSQMLWIGALPSAILAGAQLMSLLYAS